MKNILKDKNGNANIIALAIFTCIMGFGMLTVGSYIYYSVANVADAGSVTVIDEVKSSGGSWTFNGSNFSSDSSLAVPTLTSVTITYGTEVYIFEFNTTTLGSPSCKTANCILVANTNTNNSLGGATNLTARINANASAAAIVTASLSGNATLIVADVTGVLGDDIVLSETITPVGQAGWITTVGTLSGGRDSVTGQASQTALNDYVGVVFPLFGLALLILGFSVLLITVRGSFGKGGGER